MGIEPILVYLSYKFSDKPTLNTKIARLMAIKIMKKHPDWFVIVPHFAIDALLDGVVTWKKGLKLSEWRRGQAGLMSLGLLSRCDKFILGCLPTYENSAGVTWEWMFVRLLNTSYKRDNPIEILTMKDAIGIKDCIELVDEVRRIEGEYGKKAR